MERVSSDMGKSGKDSLDYPQLLGNGCLSTILTATRLEYKDGAYILKTSNLDLELQKIIGASKINIDIDKKEGEEGEIYVGDKRDYLNKFMVFKVGGTMHVVSRSSINIYMENWLRTGNPGEIVGDHVAIKNFFERQYPGEKIQICGGGSIYYDYRTSTIYFLGTSGHYGRFNTEDVKKAFYQSFGGHNPCNLGFQNPLP